MRKYVSKKRKHADSNPHVSPCIQDSKDKPRQVARLSNEKLWNKIPYFLHISEDISDLKHRTFSSRGREAEVNLICHCACAGIRLAEHERQNAMFAVLEKTAMEKTG